MKFGVAIFPSKKLQDLANSYRKRYDPHYALIPPHITLKGPFEADEYQLKNLSQRLQQIASHTEPFPLNVLKVSSFKPVNNVIYFKIDPSDDLMKLHKTLHINIIGDAPEYSFVPHITIGQNLSNDEHSDVYGQLRMMQMEHEETCDRFHLLYQLENGSWTVYETFRFGKE
ncbi:YjcG family protein [Bacillus marasmi]|uniref:YjcG family protein n=1 Tax=Bacillus marasmi TaxID=1926279 RepID=UPI0011C78AA3|nr:YjcG family protein [Bacillus marasmi]